MENVYKKGWLRREPSGRAFRYRPVMSRVEYSARLMREVLDASGDPAATLLRLLATIVTGRDHRAAYRPGPRRDALGGPTVICSTTCHALAGRCRSPGGTTEPSPPPGRCGDATA